MHVALQFIHLLFGKASPEMVWWRRADVKESFWRILKAEVQQITEELDWKSVAGGLQELQHTVSAEKAHLKEWNTSSHGPASSDLGPRHRPDRAEWSVLQRMDCFSFTHTAHLIHSCRHRLMLFFLCLRSFYCIFACLRDQEQLRVQLFKETLADWGDV